MTGGESKPASPWLISAGWPRFILIYLAIVYAFVFLLLWPGFNGLFHPKLTLFGGDFFNIWSAVKLVYEGRIMEIFDKESFRAAQNALLGKDFLLRPWFYPLHLLPFVLGFAKLPFPQALAAYLTITFVLYALAVSWGRPNRLFIALALLLSPAAVHNIVGGQNGFLTASLFVGGARLLGTNPLLAGVFWGALTIKPQLCLLIPFALVAGRHWKTAVSATVTVAAMVILSLLLYGVEPWLAYIQHILPAQRELIEATPNTVFVTTMAVTPFAMARLLGASVTAAYIVNALCAAACIAVVAMVFRLKNIPAELACGVLITATYLSSPYLLSYDLTSLSAVIVALLLWRNVTGLSLQEKGVLLMAWLLPGVVTPLNDNCAPLVPLFVVAFLVMQLRLIKRGAAFPN